MKDRTRNVRRLRRTWEAWQAPVYFRVHVTGRTEEGEEDPYETVVQVTGGRLPTTPRKRPRPTKER